MQNGRGQLPGPKEGHVVAVAVDLLYSETERDLAAALADLLASQAAPADIIARTERPEPYDAKLWRTVAAEIGIAGLLIPEALGGAGASYRELAAAAEQFGAAVAPIPYLGSAAVATAVLLSAARAAAAAGTGAAGAVQAGASAPGVDAVPDASQPLSGPAAAARDAALRAQAASGASGAAVSTAGTGPVSPAAGLLRQLADGTITAALAVPVGTGPGTAFPAVARIVGRGDGAPGAVRLRGTIRAVPDALPADVLLVPADGVPSALYLVEANGPEVHRTPLVSLDMTRQLCDITLDDAPAVPVVIGAGAEAAVSAGLAAGAAVLAAEQLGLAQRCLDMTVGYVQERRQFARQIGSFQAVKHRLADLWTAITLARAASRYAAACLADDDPDAAVAVALAKSACCDAAVTAAQECVQLHGGIGFTWEHPAHLYLKRAKAASVAYGTPGAHRAALAGLVNLPAPPP
jgi:alkylation response protein AidB-like acyl-CoA dehydrogenase